MPGKIIVIAQQKGGSGKTTLASSLAVGLAQGHDLKVAVLDVDPQGSLGEWFERREQHFAPGEPDLGFRTASGWGARRESRALAGDHDIVVVDTPPHADAEIRNAIERASLILVPVQPTPADLWATQATLDLSARSDAASLMVLNRVPPRARLTAQMTAALAETGATLAPTELRNRVIYAEALGLGLSALELKPRSPAAAETQALCAYVANTLQLRRRAA